MKYAKSSLFCLVLTLVAGTAQVRAAHATLAFISNEKGNSVSVVDLDKMAVVKTIPTGQRPRGIEFSRDGKFVYVALGDDDLVQVIDAAQLEVIGDLPSGADPEQIALDPAGKFIYVANENDAMVTVLDLGTGKASGEIKVGRHGGQSGFKNSCLHL